MNCASLLLVMGLVLPLGLMLIRPTSGVPIFDDLDSPSVFKDVGGLAELASARRKPPRQMPLSKDMTRQERVEWVKNCELFGAPCELAEQCCTKVCLVSTRECGAPPSPKNLQ
ncbi:uncharacterized protein LOC117585559 [Drosophila guanche]|uniref:uncharacterized protein LOC117585559 n=1 Tax=Drosophila guanche TaxID=7266 RepID=UPI00147152E7|nr:uncharacterized protein LOC117585559 [Drosophila guanche]